jgi:co-chaperonin GroES (HSP10)
MLEPVNGNIIAVSEKPSEYTASGIYVKTNKEPNTLLVKYVGSDVVGIYPDDRIVAKLNYATTVNLDKTDYLIFDQSDVLAVVKD